MFRSIPNINISDIGGEDIKRTIAVILMFSLCLSLLGCATPEPEAEAYDLDADISANGLTVHYPKSWDYHESALDNSTGNIKPPCGGTIYISSLASTAAGITKDSAKSVVDKILTDFYEGVENSDAAIIVSDDKEREVRGDAIVEISHITSTTDGVDYEGYMYVGFAGGNMASVIGSVPVDAEPEYLATIKAIVEAIEYEEYVVPVAEQEKEEEKEVVEPVAPTPTTPTATTSQLNAVSKAKEYLRYMAFSYTGLIGQLEYEQFSYEDAVYGADNCGADWFEQAAKKAQEYLDYMSFSRDGLIDQLMYEGFTYDQAVHGVNSVGL